jgi:hypothetical protein
VDLTQTILTFIQQNGLATGIIVFGGWFLVSKVWPWLTNDYLPAVTARQDSRDKVIAELRDAILELKALTAQLISAVQQHDASTRDIVIALGSNQQAILDLLHDHKSDTIHAN